MQNSSTYGSASNVALIQQVHGEVRGLLGLALDSDERGQHAEAIQLYQEVIKSIKTALGLRLSSIEHAEVASILEKLRMHLHSVEDRVDKLRARRPSLWSSLMDALNSFTEKSLGGSFDSPENSGIFTSDNDAGESEDHCNQDDEDSEDDDVIMMAQSLPRAPAPIGSSPAQAAAAAPATVARAPSYPVTNTTKPIPAVQQRHINTQVAVPKVPPAAPVASRPIVQPRAAPVQASAPKAAPPKRSSDARIEESLKTIDSKLKEIILNEMVQDDTGVDWDDVVGLGEAKQTLEESVILPLIRPDLFTGLRKPPRGVLLYGPPGNGKTMIAKALARKGKARFFCISASTLTSKWLGEGEKLVKALFLIARYIQPSVIFVDEIDSLLSARKGDEHEATRRLKTEFLVQMDGALTSDNEQVLVLAATNRPFDLDEAILRRLVKRIYVPLPDSSSRESMIRKLLRTEKTKIDERQYRELVQQTENMSYSDLKALCSEAALAPLRGISVAKLERMSSSEVRAITADDFSGALTRIRPTSSRASIAEFEKWTRTFGTSS